MKQFSRFLAILICAIALGSIAHAAPPTLIQINGDLSDAAWKHGRILDNFTFFSGKNNGASPQAATTGKMLTDARYLYLGFECAEPQMDKLQTTPAPRDGALWTNDSIEIFVSPFAEKSTFYHLLVDANGQVYDAINIDGKEIADYDLSVVAAAQKHENGWTVEMAIPLSNLGLSNAREALMNFGRERKPVLENTAWHGAFHQPETWQRVSLTLDNSRSVDVRGWNFGSTQYGNNQAKITLAATQPTTAKVLLQVQEDDKWKIMRVTNLVANAGQKKELNLAYELLPNRQPQAIRWTVETGNSTVFDAIYRINLPEDALIASLQTSYFYGNEKYGKLRLQHFISPSSLKTAQIRLTLKDPSGHVRQYQVWKALRPVMTVGLDLSAWTQGDGAVYVELIDKTKVMGRQRLIIPKRPGPFAQ